MKTNKERLLPDGTLIAIAPILQLLPITVNLKSLPGISNMELHCVLHWLLDSKTLPWLAISATQPIELPQRDAQAPVTLW